MVTSANASGSLQRGKRIALVIGVNEAPASQLSALHHAIADAEAMADVLQQRYGFDLLESPLVGEQATSDRVKKAVCRLARERTDEDFLLLYFSGHGLPMTVEADQLDIYLVTSDFSEVDVAEDEDAHFSVRWLSEKLYQATQASRVLVILDCCYAGDIGRTGPDPYWEELQARIKKYLGAPSAESGARSGGLRLALTATGHNMRAAETQGHGLMTSLLLSALRGEVDVVLEGEMQGQISLERLYRYLQLSMPAEQKPGLSGDSAGRDCILASYPERAAQLRKKAVQVVGAARPLTYIPFPRNLLFQPRPGEFDQLEHLLFNGGVDQNPTRLGLIGVIGMGGVGKTQLAVELAYRYQDRFPAGVFWTPATGTSIVEVQRQLADLAFNTSYLPADDDVSHPENEARRARHFCRYLAEHADALLILDNVEDPTLVLSALPTLAGLQIACPILYTSRVRYTPPGAMTYAVEQLPKEAALRLLLETTRPRVLTALLAGSQEPEVQAAREICQGVGYLPLALVHVRSLLARDPRITLVRLAAVLKARGVLAMAKTPAGDATPLFETFAFSWKHVQQEEAQRLFQLASSFPEAAPIPHWLLGLAAGLGESGDILEPLGEALLHLQELSLVEELSGEQVRLHPLVREFGRRLVEAEGEQGRALREEAARRLAEACNNLSWLEQRARREGYWECLEQVRAMRDYAGWLGARSQAQQLGRVERWLDRESYLLADQQWWPLRLPALFYQQLYNRAVEVGHPLPATEAPACWLRQTRPVGAEDQSLLRLFAGHTSSVDSVAFSPDGRLVLTGSEDQTVRLWEVSSGHEVQRLQGHTGLVDSVAFSPDGRLVLTGSRDQTARLWEVSSGHEVQRLQGHTSWVDSVAFSPDGRLAITCDARGQVCCWRVPVREPAHLLGMYVATYMVDALHWQDATHIILADSGGPAGYPHLYYLTLEGM